MNPFLIWRIYTKEAYMSENTTRDTVILGSGCAGLTAAIYTARANLKPLPGNLPRALIALVVGIDYCGTGDSGGGGWRARNSRFGWSG